MMQKETIQLLFGLKVKILRQHYGLTYQQLSERTGMGVGYLNEIEKGKKYPSNDKILKLAQALDTTYDYLVSPHSSKKLQPIVELLESDFFRTYPLVEFGLEPSRLIELLSAEPERINAFVSTVLKIARSYHLTRENLYGVALRSFQDLNDNYFPEIELAAEAFGLSLERKSLEIETLVEALKSRFGLTIDVTQMAQYPALKGVRSYYAPATKRLYLNSSATTAQQRFLLAREIGWQYLRLNPRPQATPPINPERFEVLLHNFKASYFASALLMPQYSLAADVNRCAASLRWNPNDWLQLLEIYGVTAEMFLQRLTNILPHHMGIRDLFFIRLAATSNELSDITMTKELHLSGQQSPYRTEVGEHYCRRWVSVKVMREGCKNGGTTLMLSQISHYHNTNRSYLCLSMAKTTPGQPPASITVGILMSDTMERRFTFLSDPDLPRVTVGATCETCSLNDCSERVAPPLSLQEQQQQQSIYEALQRLN